MASKHTHPSLPFIRNTAAAGCADSASDSQLLTRFLDQHDDAAFAMLVQRHGPMILGVCHRVLHQAHDAEDAFQATWLVLVKKARSLRKPESLSNWLYGVAHRTALKAKCDAARRRNRESEYVRQAVTDPTDEISARELWLVLDDEVNRLPSKYRAPFVLCILEDQTHEAAARTLGCPRKTVTTRLTRACERLHSRLRRRGLTLSAGALAVLLCQTVSAEGLPEAMVDSTARAAIQFAAGKATAGEVSARVAALTKGVITSMVMTKLKTATMLSLALVIAVVGVWTYQGSARERSATGADEKPDKERLQGTWVPVSMEVGGKKLSEQELKDKDFKTVFDGDTVTITVQGQGKEMTYKLDPSQKPKHIDLVNSKGEVTRGIYLLDGDTLKVCAPDKPGEERPKEFKSEEGSSIGLVAYKKQ